MADFSCLDLHAQGLSLVPPDRSEFADMLEAVRRTHLAETPGRPPFPREPIPDDLTFSAILINHSEKPLAELALEWKFEETTGNRYSHQWINTFGRHLLVPSRIPPDRATVLAYWYAILPGSKRLLVENQMFGDNTDVRPPRSDEMWPGGGIISSRNTGHPVDPNRIRSVVLVLDGAFFTDGEFLGPNNLHLWDDVFYENEVKLKAAHIAADGKRAGRSADEIVEEVNQYTGAAPDLKEMRLPPTRGRAQAEEFRQWHRGGLARQISSVQQQKGADGVLTMLLSWAAAPPPKLRRD